MKLFRIHIYLSIRNFIKSIFSFTKNKKYEHEISKILLQNSNKSNILLTSQCRIAFLVVLKYLKEKLSTKKSGLIDERVLIRHKGKVTTKTKIKDWKKLWKQNASLFKKKWRFYYYFPRLARIYIRIKYYNK